MDEYVTQNPYGHHTLAPWLVPPFQDYYQQIQNHTMVSSDRCYMISRYLKIALGLPGSIAECGVYRGGTAKLMSMLIREHDNVRPLHIFDSFEGMPENADLDRDSHKPGDFNDVAYDDVVQLLNDYDFVSIHRGFFQDSFATLSEQQYAFVHCDVDIFDSTNEVLEYFWPRLVDGGVLICDDYGFEQYKEAARAAVDQYCEKHGITSIALSTGQAVLIKTGTNNR